MGLSPLPSALVRRPPALPQPPANPASALSQGIGNAMSTVFQPIDNINMAIASATNGLSQLLPSFPAATMTSLAIGLPHSHSHPPFTPLPPVGVILFGCSVSVLIDGLPAARCGDIGMSPTCCGFTPMFEVFTGSSKVFIAGMRAARQLDVTMHCWPVAEWTARGAVAALVAAAKAAMMVMLVAGLTAQVAGMVGDFIDAGEETNNAAMAQAETLAGTMMAAQLAADAVAMAVGALMGKDPAIGPPVGAIAIGRPNVLIGGFPMPSGMQIAGRILMGAKRSKGLGIDEVGPFSCD